MESVGEFEYHTKDLIGHGAFAVVYKGRHKTKHDLVVAIKSITKKNLAKSQSLLGKEIKILRELAELHHENVVALLDCKETLHHVYLVMEYCNGGDLADYLNAKGTLSEDTIHLFLRQLAGAMKALNAKGIVHRDLKPQNILLCYSGKPSSLPSDITLKIADFGFARFLQDGVMAATLCGSPMYMAPEVIMSLQYDAKADLWSIGTIVFQCLTGKAPFQAQTPQALKQFYEKNSNLIPRIPVGTSSLLTDLLMRLLKRNAKDRMEFDEFFSHPFLKPTNKLSLPVPVPNCYNAFADSPPTNYSSSDSPFSKHISANWCQDHTDLTNSNNTNDDRMSNVDKSLPSFLEDQDFVIVPCCLPDDQPFDTNKADKSTSSQSSDNSCSKVPAVNMTSNGGQEANLIPHNTVYNHLKSLLRPDTLPASLSSSKTLSSYPRSDPIPVPSQREAYDQIQRSLQDSESSLKSLSGKSQVMVDPQYQSPVCSPVTSKPPLLHSVSSISTKSNESVKTNDISNLIPPTVQFAIGTPPNVGKRRSSAPCISRVQNPAWHQATAASGNPLSPILGSPTKELAREDLNYNKVEYQTEGVINNRDLQRNENAVNYSFHMALAGRTIALPEINGDNNRNGVNNKDWVVHRSGNLGKFKGVSGSSAILTSSPKTILPYHHYRSHCWFGGNWEYKYQPSGRIFHGSNCGTVIEPSPPSHSYLSYGTSPQKIDSHLFFIAPELPEETLLEKEHNETLAKLNFVLALVDCILDLAHSRSTPISALTDSYVRKEILLEQFSIISEGYRRAEQLVLYMRALHLLSSSLQLSREEVHAGRLQASTSVKNVLQILKEHFHHCLTTCKSLNSQCILQAAGIDPSSSNITADRLIYNYAIEMCQSAALEELFGNPEECFRRYQTAQILLHSLAQQVIFDDDKKLLEKYKMAVEKRLFVLQSQGYIYSYNTV